jgi:6-phosphogluconolactonase
MLASWQTLEADAEPALQVARAIAAAVQTATADRGAAFVALCGGRTPRAAYSELARFPLAWQQLTIVPTDERLVPPTHQHSNEAMLRTTLLREHSTEARLIGLWSNAVSPVQAAATSNLAMAAHSGPFDYVLLGMGADGHIASLFPNAAELAAAMNPLAVESVAVVTPGPEAPPPAVARLTLTLPRLLNARRICLLIAGHVKRELLLKVLNEPDLERWPVAALFLNTAPPVDVIWIEGEL